MGYIMFETYKNKRKRQTEGIFWIAIFLAFFICWYSAQFIGYTNGYNNALNSIEESNKQTIVAQQVLHYTRCVNALAELRISPDICLRITANSESYSIE